MTVLPRPRQLEEGSVSGGRWHEQKTSVWVKYAQGSASFIARVGSALLRRRCDSFSSGVSCTRLTDCLWLLALLDLSEWKLKLRLDRRGGDAADTSVGAIAK